MKILLFSLFAAVATNAYTQELCANWKPEIKERRNESIYTKENYLKALKGLVLYTKNDGIDPWPGFKIIEGYLLKVSAHTESGEYNKITLKNYCNFIIEQGVHRD